MSTNEKLRIVKENIRSYPDFPKKGVLFWDVFSILGNSQSLKALMDLLVDHVSSINSPIDAVIGLESRGFLLGPSIALSLDVPFVPIRKKGKLPGKLAEKEFTLEYGSDTFEIQRDSLKAGQSVLIVDDLLATGGTMNAACQLMDDLNVKVAECFVIIELTDLKGRDNIKYPIHSLIQY
ncbi:adenine phosphoribosyltransferase [Halyomorpha halys]|uniref:adenine phosphoribosyltransferase n=1 Tax=Halyomorpha halys TaxID=286706 RepID=UPI0006D51238|nr:adenine phosphoribosyltransferase [Halyomorpha halys]